MTTRTRIGIVGMGWVGSSVALSILHRGVAHELLVHDVKEELAEGEAMDLRHGASFYPGAAVYASKIEDMVDADAVVIAAGRGGGAHETRLQLLRDNAAIVGDVASRLTQCRGQIVVVTNPVDVMTYLATRVSGLPAERVLGTGTMLDTARLRQVLGRELDLDPRSIHAHVVGEHGDSEVVLWSSARIGGVPLREWSGWKPEQERKIADEVRGAAYEIIRRKGATNHAIGLVTAALLRWMVRGERRVLTVSRVQNGVLGLHDVALSLPMIVGSEGATYVVEPPLVDEERQAILRSADILRDAIGSV